MTPIECDVYGIMKDFASRIGPVAAGPDGDVAASLHRLQKAAYRAGEAIRDSECKPPPGARVGSALIVIGG